MRALVTGFQPMAGWRMNASEVLVRSLADDPPAMIAHHQDRIVYEILPADTTALARQLEALIETHDCNVCILCGQSTGRNKISLERFALNFVNFTGDGAGNSVSCGTVDADGPAAYRSTIANIDALCETLCASGIPAEVSNHAGTSLCNQSLYHVLHHGARSARSIIAGFVHVPVLPDQTLDEWPKAPSLPLETARRALATILLELLGSDPGNHG